MKENEELKQGKDKLQRDYDEAIQLANERQKGLEVLQGKLAEAGLMNEKFDFSKLSAREEPASTEASKPGEPHAVGAAATPALEAVKAEASRPLARRRRRGPTRSRRAATSSSFAGPQQRPAARRRFGHAARLPGLGRRRGAT